MYFGLCIAVVVVWLWLAGGSVYAWVERRLSGVAATLSALALTGVAGLVLLFVGPYWYVVWRVLLQPG